MKRGSKLYANSAWILFIWVCFIQSTKVNCRLQASSLSTTLNKDNSTLFIKTIFKLPAPVPKWPPGICEISYKGYKCPLYIALDTKDLILCLPVGTSFASGIIDLGALHVSQTTSFNIVWATYEGGPDNHGATFYEPSSIPEEFFMLGCYSQPNNQPLYGWVLVAKDASLPGDPPGLTLPIDYTLVWSSESQNIKQDGIGYIWLPVPPDGYTSVGHIVTTSSQKPSLDKVRVVRSVLTESVETDTWIWGANSGFNVYSLRPVERGTKALGLSVGTFIAQKDGEEMSLSCLKNLNLSYPSMPNLNQVQALIQAYAPVVYLHPDEKYFPSSVSWFFQNGALLYTKGQESNPVQIAQDGSNLPQNGSNDGTYWIDLPTDKNASDNLQKGNLQSAEAYMHIKPALGGTFTDIAVWIFCPFNGPGKIKIAFFTISLGEVGEHVSDWEHVTLRVSNFNGELQSVYYSAHSKGMWVSAPNLEFESNNKPIVYASLYGHASYPHAGTFIHDVPQPEKIIIGAQNDTSKSNFQMDTGAQFSLVGADYLGGLGIVEPPWLNYAREWGPKREFDLDKWLKDIEKVLPGKLKDVFDRFVRSLPPKALGEEGPTGPKWKDNWSGDERD